MGGLLHPGALAISGPAYLCWLKGIVSRWRSAQRDACHSSCLGCRLWGYLFYVCLTCVSRYYFLACCKLIHFFCGISKLKKLRGVPFVSLICVWRYCFFRRHYFITIQVPKP
jgi:hypothetical protein